MPSGIDTHARQDRKKMTPIVIAFTPNYFIPAAVTLKSLLDATAPDRGYEVICLVTEDIPQRQQEKLDALGNGRLRFRYINLKGRLGDVYTDPRYSEAASYRLLLPELLPEYDKVAYIDCDVVVRNDISALYDATDMGDNYLAVVYEAAIEGQAKRWEALGCDASRYFNSGFLLMNLAAMRTDHVSGKMLEASRVSYLEFPDQDVLNQVCQGRVIALPPVYNSIRTFFLPQYREDFLKIYGSDDWDEVQKKGTIHYTGGKPWNLFTVRFGDWWRVYDSLPDSFGCEWEPSPRVSALWKVYRTGAGRWMVDAIQGIYRKIRH